MSGVTRAELVAEISNFANMCQEKRADIASSTLKPTRENEHNIATLPPTELSANTMGTKDDEEVLVAAIKQKCPVQQIKSYKDYPRGQKQTRMPYMLRDGIKSNLKPKETATEHQLKISGE